MSGAVFPMADPARIGGVAAVHAGAFLAWVATAGISRTAESIAFGVIAACALIRARAMSRELDLRRLGPVRASYALMLAWMAAATLWRPEGVSLADAVPGRWCLMPLIIIPSEIPKRGLIASMSIAGLVWSLTGIFTTMGLPLPGQLIPSHPSKTFLGLTLLASVGIGFLAAGTRLRLIALSTAVLAVSFAGLAVFQSRTLAIATALSLIATPLAIGSRPRLKRIGLSVLLIIAFTAVLLVTPLGSKFEARSRQWRQMPVAKSLWESMWVLYKTSTSSRWALHEWTTRKLHDHWVIGHGADSWSHDWDRHARSDDAPPDWRDVAANSSPGTRWHAHQIYLQAVYEYGVIGVTLIMLTVVLTAVAAIQRGDLAGSTAFAVLVITMVAGLADGAVPTLPFSVVMTVAIVLVSPAGHSPRSTCGHAAERALGAINNPIDRIL